MLIGNYSVLNKNPGRAFGGSTVSDSRAQWNKSGAARGVFHHIAKFNGFPVGYTPPYSWIIARQSGGMAATRTISGTGAITIANLAGGLNAEADLSGVSELVGNLALIVSAVADLSGSGELSASIIGKLDAAAALSGTGDMVGALGAIADAVAALSGSGGAEGTLSARGSLSADILSYGELSPENLSQTLLSTVVENGLSLQEAIQVILSVVAGKSTGGGTSSVAFRDLGDSKNRVAATVDTNGNRTAITLDP
jgi:hypothetical protein